MRRSLIVVLIIVFVIVVLVLQNSSPVAIKLFFWTLNMPIALLVFLTILLGVLIGILLFVPAIRKQNEKKSKPETPPKE